MPFRSEAQRRFLWLKHPDIARRWTKKYGSKPTGSGQFNMSEIAAGYRRLRDEAMPGGEKGNRNG